MLGGGGGMMGIKVVLHLMFEFTTGIYFYLFL